MDITSPLIMLLITAVLLVVDYLIAREFYVAANAKGFYERKYLWLPFFLGVVGYLLVIALPTRVSQDATQFDECGEVR